MKSPSRSSANPTRGNRTILVGLDVLQALSSLKGPATLTQVAKASRLSLSRAYRYLRALVDGGYVMQDKASGHYDLGMGVLHLGLTAIGRVDPVRTALPAMRALTDLTGRATVLSIWGSNGPTVIRCEHGMLDLAFKIREGVNLPLLTTAAGKLFLSYLPPATLQPILRREMTAWNARNDAAERFTPAKIEAMRAEVRKHGLSLSTGRYHPTHNISAPIFNAEERMCLTITVMSVAGRTPPSYTESTAAALKATTLEISRQLGYRHGEADDAPAPKRRAPLSKAKTKKAR